MRCQDPAYSFTCTGAAATSIRLTERDLPDGTHNEQDARDWICAACGVQSRAELDHDVAASGVLKRITQRFQHWKGRAQP